MIGGVQCFLQQLCFFCFLLILPEVPGVFQVGYFYQIEFDVMLESAEIFSDSFVYVFVVGFTQYQKSYFHQRIIAIVSCQKY